MYFRLLSFYHYLRIVNGTVAPISKPSVARIKGDRHLPVA